MKQHKNVIIALGLIFCAFLAYHFYQGEKMNHLHHTYETSLAKALKSSYKDIEEIHFSKPHYSDKPGGWYVRTTLVFADGMKYKFGSSHKLHEEYDYSPSVGGENAERILKELRARKGKTSNRIKVYYSNK